jgi:hypothetical protein
LPKVVCLFVMECQMQKYKQKVMNDFSAEQKSVAGCPRHAHGSVHAGQAAFRCPPARDVYRFT